MASGGQGSPKSGGHSSKPGNSPKDGLGNTVASPVPSVPKSSGSEKSPHIPGGFPSSLPSSPEGHRAQTASTKAPVTFVLQSPPAVIARQAAGGNTARKESASATEHEPKSQSKKVEAGASSRKQPQGQSAQRSPGGQPPKRTRKSAPKTSFKGSPGNAPSRHQNLADELAAFSESDTSSPGVPVSPDEKKEAETQSHSGLFNALANSPMGDEANDQNKETGQTQEPSSAGTSASEQTTWTSAENLPDARSVYPVYPVNTEPSPPSPVWKGKQRASSWSAPIPEAIWSDGAPVFLMNDPADEGLGAYQAPGAIIEGEDMYETIIRDQIRRCKLQLGDQFTEAHADRIRDYYQEHRGIIRCPTEYSEPATIYSLSSLKAAQNPHPVFVDDGPKNPPPEPDDSTYDPISPTTQYLQAHINHIRRAVEALERNQPPEWLETRLNNACAAIARLQRRDEDVQKEMKDLTNDITTLKADIRALSGHASGTIPTAAARNLPYQGYQGLQRERPPPVLLKASLFNATAVCIALVAMVWLVLEAMLHSKRLSDGFGPFINGGYNGLASVVVFGTWKQFLWFVAVVVYVGLFAVRSALGW